MTAPRNIPLSLALAALASSFVPHGSEAALIHRYSFTDTSDAVGTANVTLHGATVNQGKLVFSSTNAYAELPTIGATVATLQNFTVEAWVTVDQQGQWARIFDFGTDISTYMMLTSQSDGPSGAGPMFEINKNDKQRLAGPPVSPQPPPSYFLPVGIETHIAVSIDYSKDFAALYINGVLASSSSGHIKLRGTDLGSTTHNWLGRSEYPDPYFKGSIDELRIYNEALTPLEVLRSYQLGPNQDLPPGNLPDVVVPATADLFGAGHPSMPSLPSGSGTRPVLIRLGGECNSVVTFSSVSGWGKAGYSSWPWTNPDGWGSSGGTNIDSCGGIAGIIHPRQLFLAGLFLDDSEPRFPAPARLDFRPAPLGTDTTFSELHPGLRQIFFIGDGLTSAPNVQQSFYVPNGATRLYLGFADAGNFFGTPGFYDDDFGSMSANVSICGQSIAAVPPPGPPEFELLGVHPNPVIGATEISFTLSKPQSVSLKIFDVSGQLVRTLTDGFLSAGPHSAQWNRRDDGGRQVRAGIYFFSLDAQGERKSSRMVVLQ